MSEPYAINAAIQSFTFIETAGYNAYRLGLNSFNAPYKPGDKRLKAWLTGYSRAKSENAKPLEVSEKNRPTPQPNIDARRVLKQARKVQ